MGKDSRATRLYFGKSKKKLAENIDGIPYLLIYQIAETLGKGAYEIEEYMPPDEIITWSAYFSDKNDKIKAANK